MRSKIESLRVKILYEQSVLTQSTGLMNLLIFAYVARNEVASNLLLWWMGAGIAVFLIRVAVQLGFRHTFLKTERDFSPVLWENVFCVGTFLSGCIWAVAGSFLLQSQMVVLQTFLAFLLAGTTAGATVAYSSSMRSVITFLLASLVPFGFTMAVQGAEIQRAMTLMIVLYIGLVIALTVRVNRYLVRSLRLAFEKDDLMSQLRQSQSDIVYSQKMSALGLMAGGLAHEMNTPLAALKVAMENLSANVERKGISPIEVKFAVTKVVGIVDRLSKIISSLRTFASVDSHRDFQPHKMSAILDHTLNLCLTRFEEGGMRVIVPEIPDDVMILARGSQIAQSLLNLMTNSFEAVQGLPAAWVKVEVTYDQRNVIVSVTDNGRGIKAELQDRLMQPFFTTKATGQGAGLGLSTARGLLQEHGADLAFDPHAQFTRFVIRLNRLPAAQAVAG